MLHKSVLAGETLKLLEEYCQLSFLKDFSLAGGTALAFHSGHRISYDLDMFCTKKFDAENINTELQSFYGSDYFSNGRLSHALFSTIKNVKSDFLFDYGKSISPVENIDALRIYSLREIIAMKLNAVTGRRRKRDFFDIYFILEQYSLQEIFDFFSAKFGEERLMMLFKSLAYFEDAESDNDPVLLKKKISCEEVKKFILSKTREIKI